MFDFDIEENISLKYLQNINVNDIFEFVDSNRSEFSKFLNWVPLIQSVQDEESYIENLKTDNSSMAFAVLFKNKLIASVGFTHIDYFNKNAQMGYCLDKNFRGKGIMTKACKKVIEYGFKNLNLQRIEFRIAQNNLKSKAIVERLSADFEGVLRKSYFINENYFDCEIYSILKNP